MTDSLPLEAIFPHGPALKRWLETRFGASNDAQTAVYLCGCTGTGKTLALSAAAALWSSGTVVRMDADDAFVARNARALEPTESYVNWCRRHVARIVTLATPQRPVLVIVDDVDAFADASGARFVDSLVSMTGIVVDRRWRRTMPIFVVAAATVDNVDDMSSSSFVTQARRRVNQGAATFITIDRPLGRAAIERIVERECRAFAAATMPPAAADSSSVVDADTRARVVAEANGNVARAVANALFIARTLRAQSPHALSLTSAPASLSAMQAAHYLLETNGAWNHTLSRFDSDDQLANYVHETSLAMLATDDNNSIDALARTSDALACGDVMLGAIRRQPNVMEPDILRSVDVARIDVPAAIVRRHFATSTPSVAYRAFPPSTTTNPRTALSTLTGIMRRQRVLARFCNDCDVDPWRGVTSTSLTRTSHVDYDDTWITTRLLFARVAAAVANDRVRELSALGFVDADDRQALRTVFAGTKRVSQFALSARLSVNLKKVGMFTRLPWNPRSRNTLRVKRTTAAAAAKRARTPNSDETTDRRNVARSLASSSSNAFTQSSSSGVLPWLDYG